MPLLRYVILHHTGLDRPHFDVMVESSPVGTLLTWRTADWPIVEPTLATRLPDHRRAYLTYEGAISDNRGHVRRVEAGETVVEFNGDEEVVVHRPDGAIRLRRIDSRGWVIAPLPS